MSPRTIIMAWALASGILSAGRIGCATAPSDPELPELDSYCEMLCTQDRQPLALCQSWCEGERLCDGAQGECREDAD